MMGEGPIENEKSPTTSRFDGGSNSLDLSSRAIEKFRSVFKGKESPKAVPTGIIVEVVDEVTV